MRAIPMDIYPGWPLRGDRDRPRTGHIGRRVTSLVMFAVLATTPLAHAQSATTAAACSDEVRRSLSNVGAWAEAQCASDQTLAFAPAFPQRCADQALQGLRRVGSWAEVQCELGD